MGLFDFLRSTKPAQGGGSYIECNLSNEEFDQRVQHAIVAFQFQPNATSEEMMRLINDNCHDEALSLALYRFIPTAWCRLFISEPQYSDEYVVAAGTPAERTYHFSKDTIYQKMLKGCRVALMVAGSQAFIYAVLRHSAEYDAINTALTNGSQLKDLVCAPVYFV